MPGSWTIHVRSRTGRTQRFGRARLTRMLRAALSGPQQQAHLAPHLADAMELFLRRRGCRMVSSGALCEMCLAALHGLGLDGADLLDFGRWDTLGGPAFPADRPQSVLLPG